jgi:hypothetical protein
MTGLVDHRREENKAAREQARGEAQDRKERIVAEAERIAAEATHWKISGERMRQLLEEWKAAPRADRAVETALWKRLSAARNAFTKRRKAYFATWRTSGKAPGHGRRSWSPTPRRSPPPPTGGRRPPPTVS